MSADLGGLDAQLQAQLAAERERLAVLQATLESTADGILVVAPGGKVLTYNQKFVRMWNIPESLLTPESDPAERCRFLSQQTKDPEGFKARVYELIQQPELEVFDLLELRDGRTFERYSQPQRLNSQIIARVWSYRDVTERQQQEKLLQQQAIAIQSSMDGIAILNREQQRFIYLNEAHAHIFGYDSATELIGQDWRILYDTAEIERFEQTVIPALEQQGRWRGEAIGRKRNGSPFYQEVSITAINEGEIVCIVRNINDRKQAEEVLKQQQEILRTVMDLVPTIISVKDWEGHYLIANQATAEMNGLNSPEELIGLRDLDIHPIRTEAERFMRENRYVIETGDDLFIPEEKLTILPNQEEWMQWQKRRIRLPGSSTDSVLVVGVSITERKRQEEALRLIVEGTASKTGDEFFQTFVRYLAEAIHMPYVLLLEFCDESKTKVRVLADYGGFPVDRETEYSLRGTPCENAPTGSPCYYPEQVRDRFPNSRGLLKRNAESYLGIPLAGSSGEIVGHLVVMDTKPMYADPGREMILRIFAARAGAELERQSAERAVQDSERKFRTIFQNSQVGVGRTRIEDGLVLEANQRFAEIMGYASAEAMIGQVYSTTFYPDATERPQIVQQLRESSGVYKDFELQLKQRDGALIWVLLSPRLNLEEDCLEFFMADISDRKRLEQELLQSQQLLNSIVENVPLALFTKDINNGLRYVQINRNSERILNCSREEAIGKNDYDLLPEDRANYFHAQDLAAITQHTMLECNDEIVDPITQDTIFVRGFKLPIFDPQGNPTHLLCIGEDVTDRKRQEEALQLIVEGTASKIGNEFFRTCVRYLAEVLHVRYAMIVEFTDESRTHLRTLACWAGDDLEEYFEYATQGTPCEMVSFGTICFYPEGVQSRFPQCTILSELQAESFLGVPLINSSGELLGHLVVMDTQRMKRDAGREMILKIFAARAGAELERKQSEMALQQAKEQAEAANRSKSAFLANMSHELRTPLNAILGFAQLMERDSTLSNQQREFLSTINRSGSHLLNLINDVLEMSKIEAGRTFLNPKPFDLHQLLQMLREMFQVRAESKHLSLQFEIAPDVPHYIVSDEGKLRQVLINLLGNAIKFTSQGGVVLRVRSGCQGLTQTAIAPELWNTASPTCRLYMEVEDTGNGIAPEDQPRLFQPFVQTMSGAQAGGTGLGLAISRQFIQLMGGDIQFTSTLGQGSTFCFTINITPVQRSQVRTARIKRRVIGLATNQPIYRILIADDQPENRDLLMRLLGTVGFETRVATNGEEAIAQWQTWNPHLIWMDMRMPVMDGYAATRRIRSQLRGQATVIIALTASAFEEERSAVLTSGCDDFVRKPFQEQIIFEKMAEHLGVKYIYEEFASPSGILSPPPSPASLTAQDLAAVMPIEWIAALQQAAIQVDAELIFQLLEQIPPHHTVLSETLADLTRRFCFDELIELTQENTS